MMSFPKSWLDLGSSEFASRIGISSCVLKMYTPPATGDAFEHEAHSVSSAVQHGQRATVSRRTGGARVQGFWPVSQIVDWIEDRAWGLVNRFAPDLAPIIRKGPLEWLKEKISNAVDSIVDTLMAPVRAITGLASSLRGHFANLLAWLRDAAAKILESRTLADIANPTPLSQRKGGKKKSEAGVLPMVVHGNVNKGEK